MSAPTYGSVEEGNAKEPIPSQQLLQVTESARACSYILRKEVHKTCKFWLLTVPSASL